MPPHTYPCVGVWRPEDPAGLPAYAWARAGSSRRRGYGGMDFSVVAQWTHIHVGGRVGRNRAFHVPNVHRFAPCLCLVRL